MKIPSQPHLRNSESFSTWLFCSNRSIARNCSISSVCGSGWVQLGGRYWTRTTSLQKGGEHTLFHQRQPCVQPQRDGGDYPLEKPHTHKQTQPWNSNHQQWRQDDDQGINQDGFDLRLVPDFQNSISKPLTQHPGQGLQSAGLVRWSSTWLNWNCPGAANWIPVYRQQVIF